MNNLILLLITAFYFLLIYFVAHFSSKNSTLSSFFVGTKNSNTFLVAFGMIGTSLSGITFISVPGTIGNQGFTYFQVSIGYLIGYILIAYLLIPAYYSLNLTSIYKYLENKLGLNAYRCGAFFFIISRLLGSTARLYLVINILQLIMLEELKIPFIVTTLTILLLIWGYTQKGGVKTLIWTDTLQTFCMLFGLFFCFFYLKNDLNLSFNQLFQTISPFQTQSLINNNWLNLDINKAGFWGKQVLAGILIATTMTGMDQEMMQKNISIKTVKQAKFNMLLVGFLVVTTILVFLVFGGVLHIFAQKNNITATGDNLFPTVVLEYLPSFVSIIFIIALISALFPSADGALTALTSSFYQDILNLEKKKIIEIKKVKIRKIIHLTFTLIFLFLVIFFKWINNDGMINIILKIATYTYGPLLGLFSFALLIKRKLNERLVPIICILAPILCFLLDKFQTQLFQNYQIGLELLFFNGLLCFLGLLLISHKK